MTRKTPPKRKNVSQTISNGTLIITNDKDLSGADGNSTKIRMATVIDSNRDDEVAIVKYTTSKKHGRKFKNSNGFIAHGDRVITKTIEGKPITIDGRRFVIGSKNRSITQNQANEIKRRNLKESKYKKENRKYLKNLKKRTKK